MSTQCLVARCHNCEEKTAKVSPDPNNPFFNQDDGFCLTLEWKNKEEITEEVKNKKCPRCSSEDWYLTDSVER